MLRHAKSEKTLLWKCENCVSISEMFIKVSEEPDMSSTINETSKHLREQECLFLSHIFLRCLMSSMGTKLKYLRP